MRDAKVNDVEELLDNLDLAAVATRDATHFRRIVAAQDGVQRADGELRAPVRAA